MNEIVECLDSLYRLTKKIDQFINSELEFDVKLEQVELMMRQRAELFDAIDASKDPKPADYKQRIAAILAIDRSVEEAMQGILEEQKLALCDIRAQKRHASKSKLVHNEYLKPQVQSGYFINRKE